MVCVQNLALILPAARLQSFMCVPVCKMVTVIVSALWSCEGVQCLEWTTNDKYKLLLYHSCYCCYDATGTEYVPREGARAAWARPLQSCVESLPNLGPRGLISSGC